MLLNGLFWLECLFYWKTILSQSDLEPHSIKKRHKGPVYFCLESYPMLRPKRSTSTCRLLHRKTPVASWAQSIGVSLASCYSLCLEIENWIIIFFCSSAALLPPCGIGYSKWPGALFHQISLQPPYRPLLSVTLIWMPGLSRHFSSLSSTPYLDNKKQLHFFKSEALNG